jgi:hypothetical protein
MIVPVNIVAVQCNQNNSLFVTTGVDYDSDGAIVGSEITSQYTLNPGDSLEGQPTEVVNIANALWTPAVVEAYKLANPVVVKDASTNSWSNDSVTGTPATLRAEQIVDPLILPTSDVPPSVDGMSTNILG